MQDRLTWFSLFNLLGHQRKGGEKLYEYLDDHLSHSDRRCDLGIDLQAGQKAFHRLEQLNQRIVTVRDAFDRLIGLDVTMICDKGLKEDTYGE